MRWFNRYNFPYSNFHDLNLDWILQEMTRIREEWETVKAEWEQMKIDWAEFQERMERLWAEYKELMNRLWQEFKTQMEGEWEDYQAQMDEAWELYQQQLNQAWQNYQHTLNTWKAQVDQDITNKFNEIDEKCRQCKAEVDAALEDLTSQWTAFKTWVENYLANLDIASIILPRVEEYLQDLDPSTLVGVFVTPEQYGAVGDGSTDDTQAFAQMLQSNLGKAIYLYPGKRYVLNASFSLAGRYLLGNGATIEGNISLTSGGAGGVPAILDGVTITGMVDGLAGAGNPLGKIQLRDCTINGDMQLSHAPDVSMSACDLAGLYFTDCDKISISDSIIRSNGGFASAIMTYQSNLSISDCIYKVSHTNGSGALKGFLHIDNSHGGSSASKSTSYVINGLKVDEGTTGTAPTIVAFANSSSASTVDNAFVSGVIVTGTPSVVGTDYLLYKGYGNISYPTLTVL